MATESPSKHQELLTAPESIAELEVERADEIVALVCVVKPQLNMEDAAVKLAVNRTSIEVVKAGTKPFKMRPNKFLKMKRSDAEWHVSKAGKNDLSNPLTLVVKSLVEIEKGQKGVAPLSYREKLLAQAKKERLIVDDVDAENVSDSELASLLKTVPIKDVPAKG